MSDPNTNAPDDVDAALAAWTPMEPPASFVDRVLAAHASAVPERRRRSRWVFAAPIAAVAMIAIVVFVFGAQNKAERAVGVNGAPTERMALGDTQTQTQYAKEQSAVAPSGSNAGSGTLDINAGSGSAIAMNQVTADASVALLTQPVEDPPQIEPSIHAGESVTIHEPATTTRVQIVVYAKELQNTNDGPPCSSSTLVTARSGTKTVTANGLTRATLALDVGTWSYAAECQTPTGGTVPTGTIHVVEDKANRPILAADAAQIDIVANGRTQRVSYQTTVPNIRVKLSPSATSVAITPKSGHAFELPVSDGVAMIPSGTLAAGEYTLVDKTTAKQTKLVIAFDATAPKLYIASIQKAPAGGLVVTGSVAPGWTLPIPDNATVEVDNRFRFTMKVKHAGRIVIRVEHPTLGIHYYATMPITP